MERESVTIKKNNYTEFFHFKVRALSAKVHSTNMTKQGQQDGWKCLKSAALVTLYYIYY